MATANPAIFVPANLSLDKMGPDERFIFTTPFRHWHFLRSAAAAMVSFGAV